MKDFLLVNIRDEKQLKKFQRNSALKQSVLLPCFCEGYVCFSFDKEYSFEELLTLFLHGDMEEAIGAVSIIAESFPQDLYILMRNHADYFTPEKLKFLLDFVVPSYLPLMLPKERIMEYDFQEKFSDDIWVNILQVIKEYS